MVNMNKKEIQIWLDRHNIENAKINDDLIVNVAGDVFLCELNLKEIPFKFGKVYGDFNVLDNQLTNFKNFPNFIEKDLIFSYNFLACLENLSAIILGSVYCTETLIDEETLIRHSINFKDTLFHCAKNEDEFLTLFANYYKPREEDDLEYDFTLSLPSEIFHSHIEKLRLEQTLNQASKINRKIKV